MRFAAPGSVHVVFLWISWVCLVALVLVPRRAGGGRRLSTISLWGWGLSVTALILYLVLRRVDGRANSGAFVMFGSHDRFVAMCLGYVLAAGRFVRRSEQRKRAGITWGVAAGLVGAAAGWGVVVSGTGGLSAHLGSPFYALSDAVLSAAVGIFTFAIMSEWMRFWAQSRGSGAVAEDRPTGAVSTCAAMAAWAALLLESFGTFLTRGALWSWDPVELWHLSLVLLYALLAHGRQVRGSGLGRAVTYSLALAFSVFVLFGVYSLTRLLGLSSRFVW